MSWWAIRARALGRCALGALAVGVIVAVWSAGAAADPQRCGGEDDPEQSSTACLSCHDGSVGSNVTHTLGRGEGLAGRGFQLGRLGEHSIDIDYRDAYTRPASRLRPAATLDRTIRLPQGRVQCTSCHDLRSDRPARLVMSNERSALCLSCHAM